MEPGIGLVNLRDRCYDPATGAWLTPDPESYGDSSNLYAGFRNDPVNNSDPTGRLVPQLIGCGASVLIGAAITEGIGGDYTWKDADVDCGLGAATAGLSALGQLRHLRHASKLTRFGARVGAETTVDVGGEWARREWKGEKYTWGELATGAALNAVIGEGGAFVGARGAKWFAGWGNASKALETRKSYASWGEEYVDDFRYVEHPISTEGTGRDYHALLEAEISSQEFVYRYMSEETLQASLRYGSVRGYSTTVFTHSSRDAALGGQIRPEWGTPRYGVAIPVSKLRGFDVPLSYGNKGGAWEPFTYSYPDAGVGGWSQFLLHPIPIEHVFIFSLKP